MYPVHQLPLRKAYADQVGLGRLLTHDGPTAMEVEAGTVGLALVLDTLSGRSPRSRLEECCAQHDTARLFGKTVPPQALNAATAGRVRERLDDFGPRRLCTAWAVRAATRLGVERRAGHWATTWRSGWGASPGAAPQARPLQVP